MSGTWRTRYVQNAPGVRPLIAVPFAAGPWRILRASAHGSRRSTRRSRPRMPSRSPGANGFAHGTAPLGGRARLLGPRSDPCPRLDHLHVLGRDARRLGEIVPVAKPLPLGSVTDDPTRLVC